MAEERVARALRHLSEDAGLLSVDGVLELIEDYFDSDDPSGTVQPHPCTLWYSSCMLVV